MNLPDWLVKEAWEDFVRMRKAIKKPLTERAMIRSLKKLDALRKEGQDPNAVLDQSVDCCWMDLYPVKNREVTGIQEDYV